MNNAKTILNDALEKGVLTDVFLEVTKRLDRGHLSECIDRVKQRYQLNPQNTDELMPIINSLEKIINNENAQMLYTYYYQYLYYQVNSLDLFGYYDLNSQAQILKKIRSLKTEEITQRNNPRIVQMLNGIHNLIEDESVYIVLRNIHLSEVFNSDLMKNIILELPNINEDEFKKAAIRVHDKTMKDAGTPTKEAGSHFFQYITEKEIFPLFAYHIKSTEKSGYILYKVYLKRFKELFFMQVRGIISISGYFNSINISPSMKVNEYVSFFESIEKALHPENMRHVYGELNEYIMELMKACIFQYIIYEPFNPMDNLEENNDYAHVHREEVYKIISEQRKILTDKLNKLFILNKVGLYNNLYFNRYENFTENYNQNIIAYFKKIKNNMKKFSIRGYLKRGLLGGIIGTPVGGILHSINEGVSKKESRKELNHIIETQKKFLASLSSYENALFNEYELFFEKLMRLVEPYGKNIFYHYQPTRILGLQEYEEYLTTLLEKFLTTACQSRVPIELMPYMNYKDYESKQFKGKSEKQTELKI